MEFSGKPESVKLRGSLPKLPEIGKHVWLFLYSKKKIAYNVQTTEGYHSLVCQGKYMPNALKGIQNWKMVSVVFVRVAAPLTKSSLWSKSLRKLGSLAEISLRALSIFKNHMTEFLGINFRRFCGSMVLMVRRVLQPPQKFENFIVATSTLAQVGGFAQKPFCPSFVKICQCLGVPQWHQNFDNFKKKMFFSFWIFLDYHSNLWFLLIICTVFGSRCVVHSLQENF